MHGFGAPGTDLVPLARVMDVDRSVRFVFPEAPSALPPQYGAGRAWWLLDMERMQRAMMLGLPRDLSEEHPEALPEVRAQVVSFLDAIRDELGVPDDRVVLGGFSQGAMLACDVALHTERPFAGLALLSGSLLAKEWWLPKMPSLAGKRVFQSHGHQDSVLSFSGGEALRDGLVAAGADVAFVSFRGGHEIPAPVLDGLSGFIGDVLPSAP